MRIRRRKKVAMPEQREDRNPADEIPELQDQKREAERVTRATMDDLRTLVAELTTFGERLDERLLGKR